MRTPEEQEAFLSEGRFKDASPGNRRTSFPIAAVLIILYWALTASVFFFNFFLSFLLTLPWSYFIMLWRTNTAANNHLVENRQVDFIAFPLLCGGINSILPISLTKLLTGFRK
jgi:hypothetical protein